MTAVWPFASKVSFFQLFDLTISKSTSKMKYLAQLRGQFPGHSISGIAFLAQKLLELTLFKKIFHYLPFCNSP